MEDRNNDHAKRLVRAAEEREHGDEVRLRREKELEERIRELETALTPFANAAFDLEHEDDYERSAETTFTVGDCRTARRALIGKEQTEVLAAALKAVSQ